MYIFPGLGLGASISRSRTITDSMIYEAAASLANSLTPSEVAEGLIYPRLMRIRDISATLAADVAIQAVKEGLAEDEDIVRMAQRGDRELLIKFIRASMYDPQCECFFFGRGGREGAGLGIDGILGARFD